MACHILNGIAVRAEIMIAVQAENMIAAQNRIAMEAQNKITMQAEDMIAVQVARALKMTDFGSAQALSAQIVHAVCALGAYMHAYALSVWTQCEL
eukprot:83168-Pelagomonas_calceolata.AAC.4